MSRDLEGRLEGREPLALFQEVWRHTLVPSTNIFSCRLSLTDDRPSFVHHDLLFSLLNYIVQLSNALSQAAALVATGVLCDLLPSQYQA